MSLNYNEIGKVVFLDSKVFYCPKCDNRYDYAIIYKDYPNKPSCKICNADMEIKETSMRLFGVPHPKKGGW